MKYMLNYMLFTLAVLMLIFASGCTRQQQIPAPEVSAEIETVEEQAAAVAEETEEAEAPSAAAEEKEEKKEKAEKEKPQLAPEYATPNSVVISEKTVLGSAADIEKKEEKSSWFSGVTCGKLFPDGQSLVIFTIENKGKKSYYLSKVDVEEVTEKDGIVVQLNSDKALTNVKKQCGTDLLLPGKKVTCTVKEKLRKGKTFWEKELVNKLAASSVGVYTELKFKCEGIAE